MKLKAILCLALIAVLVAGCTTYPPNGTAITLTYPDGQTPGETTDTLGALDEGERGTGTTTVRGLRVINDASVGNVLYGKSSMIFEGATDDTSETTLTMTDPTADRTIVFPNAAGTVMLSTLATNAPDAANSVTGASNALVFEGATANDYEISLSPADAGADVTITVPAVAGVMKLGIDTVLAKAGNYTVATTDSGATIKVTGAYTMTLPAAAAGLRYCIVNYDGSDLTIDFADATDAALNEVNSPGDRVTNTTAYDSICLQAIDSTNWVTLSSLGTWSDGN